MEELKKAIAFLFKRKGRDSMSDTDFVMSASMDLRWFVPKEAQQLLRLGLELKLLTLSEGKLSPSFDVESIEMPLDYTPPPSLLDLRTATPDLFAKILDRILTSTQIEKKQVISMVNATQEELDVDIEVASLIVARNAGVDISDLIDEVEQKIVSRPR